MQHFPPHVENLIDHLARLPGIGRKSAQRLAFHILSLPREDAEAFSEAILKAKLTTRLCGVCQNLTDGETCPVCRSAGRDVSTICVVQDPKDVAAIERTCEYRGLYHVLHGVISPMAHIGPDDIRIKELIARVHSGGVSEVIMATNPDTEGETTAMYISRLLTPFDVRISRLALGIPIGSQLEFTDEATLARAIEGRRTIRG